ncbi:hypothetical protein [Dyella acidisoli]|uniref:Uncharacterized protein n=1 Tax=Dyella acidisoli TaxID=1867834 RepID=A0ABQ5XJ67_9GAMM|nr:hypothetical protein [Dyella acidisoli]GLQ91720.1 hypothetical protein GCM10007901_06700 [Dyella acidisoli]
MYIPRTIRSSPTWQDEDSAKIYTVSVDAAPVDRKPFYDRLRQVKVSCSISWPQTPHFSIFHKGATMLYLVVCWWGNGNELFTSVSVLTSDGWVEQSERYSFCLYDMEIMWDERNIYIETIDCERPDLLAYQTRRKKEWITQD